MQKGTDKDNIRLQENTNHQFSNIKMQEHSKFVAGKHTAVNIDDEEHKLPLDQDLSGLFK